MSTSGPTQTPSYLNASADLQSFATIVHNALSAIGLVQTSDTGQTAPGSLTLPGAANTVAGYEVWRFNDSLQSSVPIFLKVEYGTAGATNRPAIWFTAGSGSNGSGTITGQVTTRTQLSQTNTTTVGQTYPSYFSAGAGWLAMALNIQGYQQQPPMYFLLERTRDGNGNPTADGWLIAMASPTNSSCYVQAVPASGTLPSANSNTLNGVVDNPASTGNKSSDGTGNIAVGVGTFYLAKPFYTLTVGVALSDVALGSTFTASVFGANHTYMAVGGGSAGQTLVKFASNTGAMAIPWE